MADKPNFMKLDVWMKAKDLAVYVYKVTDTGKIAKDYSLRDQLRRSSASIASNIAEGDERETDKEAVRFFYIARGSSAELLTQTVIAYEVGYFGNEILEYIKIECITVSKMLYNLIRARSKTFHQGG